MEGLTDVFLKACRPQQRQQQPLSSTSPALTPPLRKAAVLLPLFQNSEDGEIHCLLTVRSSHMRSHAGEVCFPGGKIDEGETAIAAALREAWEEIGLPSEAVRIVGEMTPTLSLHLLEVTPVVAFIPADFVPRPNPEVCERSTDDNHYSFRTTRRQEKVDAFCGLFCPHWRKFISLSDSCCIPPFISSFPSRKWPRSFHVPLA